MSSVRNTWAFFAVLLLSLFNAAIADDVKKDGAQPESPWKGWQYNYDHDWIAFTSPDGRKMAAFSQITGHGWKVYATKNECTLGPVLTKAYVPGVAPYYGDVVALKLVPSEENPVTCIAAFNVMNGAWVEQELIEPANETIEPKVGDGSIYYQIGNRYYAFSALESSWGVLELGEGEFHQVITGNGLLVVQTPTAVHAFNASEGLWFSIKPDEIVRDAAR